MSTSPLAGLLADWLPAQRWFAGEAARGLQITSDALIEPGDPELRHLIVSVEQRDHRVAYQLLLGMRRTLPPELAASAIGTMPDGRIAYDGAIDPEVAAVLLDGIARQRRAGPVRFAAEPGAVIDRSTPGRALPALASNTSIVYGDNAILKLLRRPLEGHHPDLEVPAALARNGSKLVAPPLGWIELGGAPGAPAVLAILSEYFPNSTDAWSLAIASLTEPRPDFAAQARELGEATATLHAELAAAFGVSRLERADLAAMGEAMAAELDRAVEVVPVLARHSAAIRSAYADVAGPAGEVSVQRIHGDYHLAQVLRTDGGWVVLDFEGEPSVPLSRRRALAPALRDVAGMLRSFDYASRHHLLGRQEGPPLASVAAEWAARCEDAFCSGYAAVSRSDPRAARPLLRALTLQKAVYEAVYEASHRPDWLPIPLEAIEDAIGAGAGATTVPSAGGAPGTGAASGLAVEFADPVDRGEIDRIVAGEHHDPHAVLGAHATPQGVIVRTLRPLAQSVAVVLPDRTRVAARHVHEGVFSALVPLADAGEYRLAVSYGADGPELLVDDPYRYLPTLGEMDLHLIGEGRHEELWRALGARVRRAPSTQTGPDQSGAGRGELVGTSFAVWAPSARGVRLIGDFNHWDGQAQPMRSLGQSGVWELFVPGVGPGTAYKYEIRGKDGSWHRKADPMATMAETPPATASVVFEPMYEWADDDWMTARAQRDPLREPFSVYEVHIGSWRPGLSYRQLAEELVDYVRERQFTHVEFLPVAEHPFGGSWGYQVTSYYAPSARFGTPDDFRYLVDRLHQAGIGVLVDWVPAHFPRDEWALARFDGTSLYEHSDPHRGEHPDWGTLIFDFGRREVRNFLVANAVYWLEEFHIDGLRVDAVASMLYLDYSRKPGQWTPNVLGGRENLDAVSFLQEVNATCYKRSAGIVMAAEESTAWPGVTRPVHLGGLGFGLKWNMGWMHDILAYLEHDPVHRRYHHNELTFSMMYAYSENFVLPLSHDEVVHGKGSLVGKMPGDEWKKFANLRALFGYMWAHPGKQLLFMGSEFGQWPEWSEQNGLDWAALAGPPHVGLRRLVDELNRAYRQLPALWRQDFAPAGFSWIDANDAFGNVISFLRLNPDAGAAAGSMQDTGTVVCVANFSGDPHYDYRLGLPSTGTWREVINSDAEVYGGSGVGNFGRVESVAEPWHGRPASAVLTVPPLATLWLVHEARPADGGSLGEPSGQVAQGSKPGKSGRSGGPASASP